MKDEFFNRLGMFKASRDVLHDPAFKPTWFGLQPVIFTTKIAAAVQAILDLEAFCTAQGLDITGVALDKAREKKDVEDVSYSNGSALAVWFRDHDNEASAAICDLTLTAWRELRDQDLLQKAGAVRDLYIQVAAIPEALDYGITSAGAQAYTDEINQYATAIAQPQSSIAQRKALTRQLRERFNAVEALFDGLDRLILRFDQTPAGRALIAAYKAARVIRDLGHGPSAPVTPPTP